MSMQNFMKKSSNETGELTTEELMLRLSAFKQIKPSKMLFAGVLLAITTVVIFSVAALNNLQLANIEPIDSISSSLSPIAAAASKKDVISIPSGIVKANPFVPYRQLAGEKPSGTLVEDVPRFDLLDPPEIAPENSDAVKVMDTVVSGILYDKFSSSAILNIDGNDYLVKKGDTVNNYKIIAIARDSVTVKLGKNTYKAGIGEPLTDGEVNINEVSNLSKKFGGEQR